MQHSTHGFSGQHITMQCPGSVAMKEGIEEPENPAAVIGTAVHEVGENALIYGVPCSDLVGQKFNGKRITKKMAESAQVYVDYVNSLIAKYPGAKVMIEKKVKMSSVDGGLLWGTSDVIIYVESERLLIVGDFKNGWGIVEPDMEFYIPRINTTIRGNPQLMGYVASVIDTENLHGKVGRIETFIAQPNPDHSDGKIRTASFDMSDYYTWINLYRKTHSDAIKEDAQLYAGEHCKFCAARGVCAKNLNRMVQSVKLDTPLRYATPEQLIAVYELSASIKKGLEGVENQVLELSRKGHKIPGKKLVRAIVRAQCTDEDSFISEAITAGIDESELYNLKLKSKTDLKKIVGDDLAHKYFKTPTAGYTLVDNTDTRPAAMSDRKPKFDAIK